MMTDQPKACPRCRLLNPPSAMRCDCGYDFTNPDANEIPARAGAMKILAKTLLVAVIWFGAGATIAAVLGGFGKGGALPMVLLAAPFAYAWWWVYDSEGGRVATGLFLGAVAALAAIAMFFASGTTQ